MAAIDDITLAYRFPPGHDFHVWSFVPGEHVLRTRVHDKRRKRDLAVSIVRGRGMILRVCDETREVRLTLSIPRLAYPWSSKFTYNFPLREKEDIEGFDLIRPARFVVDTLGLKVPPETQDVNELLRIERWPIVRVAYALDVDVGAENVFPTMRTIADIERARSTKAQAWLYKKQVTGVQFAAGDRYRAMFYSKRAEIETRIRALLHRHEGYGGRGPKEFKQKLAEAAAGIIRFEITFMGATKMRQLFGLPTGVQPTFKFMARRHVGDYLLFKELDALRLMYIEGLEDVKEEIGQLDELLRQLCTLALKFNEDPEGRNSRRTRVSLARVYALLGRCVTSAQPDLVATWFGGQGESTAKELARDLRALGMPQFGSTSSEAHRRLHAFVEAVARAKPLFPTVKPELPEDAELLGDVADAPWANELVDYEEGEGFAAMSDDDEEGLHADLRAAGLEGERGR